MKCITAILAVVALLPCACGGGASQESSESPVSGGSSEPQPEPVLVHALDVSHWSGTIASAQADCWVADGWTHLIPGTQNAAITQQQLQTAVDAGMTVDAYVYLYFGSSMTAQVQNALDIIQGFPVGRLWLDIEDNPGSLSIAQIEARIQEAIDACGSQPYGLYCAKWWWQPHMNNGSAFNDVPLWYARYDGVDSLDTWNADVFGGWTAPTGKQYAGNVSVCGVNTDLNVMWINGAPPGPQGLPPAPTGLASVQNGSSVTMSSASVAGAVEYEFRIEYTNSGSWSHYYTYYSADASQTFWPQIANKTYRFRVRARNAVGWGPGSVWAQFDF